MDNERKMLEARETNYGDDKFRSRNEAKHAVFLSHLGIDYKYEQEDMNGRYGRVLPDFYLPSLGIYYEVKHNGFSEDDRVAHLNKFAGVVRQTGKPCMIAYGDPRDTTVDKWNNSVLIFYNVKKSLPTFSQTPKLSYTLVKFSSDSESIYLSTDIGDSDCCIVVKENNKWVKRPIIYTKNTFGRNVEKVALYARQYQFEYVEDPPMFDTRVADEAIEAAWRSKNAPKATYVGESRPTPIKSGSSWGGWGTPQPQTPPPAPSWTMPTSVAQDIPF